MAARTAYPLAWPEEWPRTVRPAGSQFRTTLAGALENVEKSLAAFAKDSGRKVTELLISSNVTLGNLKPTDAGVAIYFTWDGLSTCVAVDRYAKVEENLQAIHHVIEAERTKLRHGGLNLVRAAFRGYAKLPPPSAAAAAPWYEVLGLDSSADVAAVESAWKRLRSQHHPDKGGDAAEFSRVKRAYDEAMCVLGA
jgi:hypothetical protein